MLALAVLPLAACNTDVDHPVPSVDSPALVSVSPQDNLKAGLDSIVVTYDRNVFLASADYQKITLNGQPVQSAHVMGSSSQLLIMADIQRDGVYELNIPEGVVTGPGQMPAAQVTTTLKAQSQTITTQLANPNATAETRALYDKLVANYGKKTYSATMADVAWNNKNAEHVHQLTGKYPAINGYDFIHLNNTAKGGWIDYSDITPVKTWHDGGGIVTASWHWNVPTSDPNASSVPVTLSAEQKKIPSDWSGFLMLTSDEVKTTLAKASVGSKLVVNITDVAAGAQGSVKNGATWTGLVDGKGTSYEYFDISGSSFSVTLDQKMLDDVRANGFIISGHDYTVTSITVEAAGEVKYAFYASENGFTLDEAVTEGTWQNTYVKQDLAKIVPFLRQLQAAGIPVLWRPLHEAAGRWFWWGNGSAESYRKLWTMMFDYFKAQGVNNLIWVWTSEVTDESWYPGDAYVDIIGTDMYGQNGTAVEPAAAAERFNRLAYRYPTKMIALSECGTVADIPSQWAAGGGWSWFMPWYNSAEVSHATDDWWKAAMSSDKVLSRGE